jgi:hypothetical protein
LWFKKTSGPNDLPDLHIDSVKVKTRASFRSPRLAQRDPRQFRRASEAQREAGPQPGAVVHVNGLNIVPSDFGTSFDGFRTMRRCWLIWRDGDLVGAAFES